MSDLGALDPDRIVEQAITDAGSDDLGEPTWREGLERLTASLCDEAQLNPLGVDIVARELAGYLAARARIVTWARDHPEVDRGAIRPPIVIVGQPRTGTTILFDLLAQDPANRVPRTWEVDRPVPPPATDTYDIDPRIAEVDATLEMVDLVVPGFRSHHPLGARLGQECVRITAGDLRSMIFPTQYRVPSYARWLLHEADHAPAYRWHHTFLRHLHAGHPGARWVLKSPAHIWTLDALIAEHPRALLVQTHRDPLKVVASVSALIAVLRRLATDDPSLPEIAQEWSELLLDGLDRSIDARDSGVISQRQVVDVHFRRFMSDPFGTIREIYERLELELTAEAERRMRTFLAAHPGDGVGRRYTFAATGLDEASVRDRAARYVERFDVDLEPV